MKIYSESRHRATAAEQRIYGGTTVTKFICCPSDDAKTWFYVESYGATPGERKSLALQVATLLVERGKAETRATYKATPAILKGLQDQQ
jgi:hypothetical protein